MTELNFIESAKLRAAILRDLTSLALDRQIEARPPELIANAAQLLILRYLTEVVSAGDIAEQFAACVGVATETGQAASKRD